VKTFSILGESKKTGSVIGDTVDRVGRNTKGEKGNRDRKEWPAGWGAHSGVFRLGDGIRLSTFNRSPNFAPVEGQKASKGTELKEKRKGHRTEPPSD